MKYSIHHYTRYEFSEPVFLEPHIFRFTPRTHPRTGLRKHSIDISPSPAGQSLIEEASGTVALTCWFNDLHTHLNIEAAFMVEVESFSPFSFLIDPPDNATLPIRYSKNTHSIIAESLKASPLGEEAASFVKAVSKNTSAQTISFLAELTAAIHSRFQVVSREVGEPLPPSTTFGLKEASCRDLAWMQVQMLRSAGIAARFVSGYLYLEADGIPQWELHAWVEAFIPGGGWIGFDPSHGISCTEGYIPVAASPFPEDTMPVTGTVRGDARATLTHKIEIDCEPTLLP